MGRGGFCSRCGEVVADGPYDAADDTNTFLLSGTGDVIEPDEGVVAIGSGGIAAQAAAQALVNHSDLAARSVVAAAMAIAGSLCVFTNDQLTIEEI